MMFRRTSLSDRSFGLFALQTTKLCRKAKIGAVAVLGHPEYYPKFGFEKSEKFNLNSEYDVPPGVFMIAELENGYLKNCSGTISYHEEFSKL